MKKLVFILFAALSLSSAFSYGQTAKDFRTPGYKASVSLSDQFGVWVGFETSHGAMINRKDYLGLGMAGYIFPNGKDYPMFANVYADYDHYFKDSSSTPVVGIKAGYMNSLNPNSAEGFKFNKAVYLEPNVGWNWLLKSGCGLTTSLGASVYRAIGECHSNKKIFVAPKISIALEF